MLLRPFAIETRKMIRSPLLWGEFAGLVCVFAVYFLMRYWLVAASNPVEPVNTANLEPGLQTGLGLLGFFSISFVAAAAALVCTYDPSYFNERKWKVRGIRHVQPRLARFAAVLIAGFMLVTVVMFASLGLLVLAHSILPGGFTTQNIDWAQVFMTILEVFWGSLPYIALTILLGIIGRSALFAAGGTLVFNTVFEILFLDLTDRFPALARFLPNRFAFMLEFNSHAMDRTAELISRSSDYFSEPQVILAIATLVALFTGFTIIIFSRRERGR